jgi:hypothetical protein
MNISAFDWPRHEFRTRSPFYRCMVNEKPTAARFPLNASATLIDHKSCPAALRGFGLSRNAFRSQRVKSALLAFQKPGGALPDRRALRSFDGVA